MKLGATAQGGLLAGAGLLLALASGCMQSPQPAQPQGAPAAQHEPAGPSAMALPASPQAAASSPLAYLAPVPVAGADPNAAFMQAVQLAREKPLPPPPPEIAQARSLPEAFAAMQAAQRDSQNPPPGTAGINPFATAGK